jgi:hypothetical protein
MILGASLLTGAVASASDFKESVKVVPGIRVANYYGELTDGRGYREGTKLFDEREVHEYNALFNCTVFGTENALAVATKAFWNTTPEDILKKTSISPHERHRLELFLTTVDSSIEYAIRGKLDKSHFALTQKFTDAMKRPGQIGMHGESYKTFYISLGRQERFVPEENKGLTLAGTVVLAVYDGSPLHAMFAGSDARDGFLNYLRQKRAEWYAENLVNGKYIVDPIHRSAIGLTLLAVAATGVGAAAIAYKKGAFKRLVAKPAQQEQQSIEDALAEATAQ